MANLLTIAGSWATYRRLRASQWASPQDLQARAVQRLRAVVTAARAIPFYESRLRGARIRDEEGRWPALDGTPILRREEVSVLADSVRGASLAAAGAPAANSSGSTGTPVPFLFDAAHQRGRFAARMRYLVENGWRPSARTAWVIELRPGSPDAALTTARWLPGASFLSHILPVEDLAQRLLRLRPRFLYSLPSTVDALLEYFSTTEVGPGPGRLVGLRGIFTSGEVVEDGLRRRVRERWGLEIADAYGATEAFPAWQCPQGRYHVNAEHVLLELVDDQDRPVPPGTPGRVLLTTLENHLMPLLRWEIGDWAVADPDPCSCGRGLPVLRRVLGRGMNLIRRADGGWLSPWVLVEATKDLPPVRQAQIVQHAVDRFTVRIAADRGLEPSIEQAVRDGFDRILGIRVTVTIERVDEIPRTANGKLLAAMSEIA